MTKEVLVVVRCRCVRGCQNSPRVVVWTCNTRELLRHTRRWLESLPTKPFVLFSWSSYSESPHPHPDPHPVWCTAAAVAVAVVGQGPRNQGLPPAREALGPAGERPIAAVKKQLLSLSMLPRQSAWVRFETATKCGKHVRSLHVAQ